MSRGSCDERKMYYHEFLLGNHLRRSLWEDRYPYIITVTVAAIMLLVGVLFGKTF